MTNSSSSNKRASVKNLSAKQLEKVIDKFDISLDEFYKINKSVTSGSQNIEQLPLELPTKTEEYILVSLH